MKKEFVGNVFIAGTSVPCIHTEALCLEGENGNYITRIYALNQECVTVYDYILWCFTYVNHIPGPMPSFKVEYWQHMSLIKVTFISRVLCYNDICTLFDSALGPNGNDPCITVENGNIVVNITLEE